MVDNWPEYMYKGKKEQSFFFIVEYKKVLFIVYKEITIMILAKSTFYLTLTTTAKKRGYTNMMT